MPEFKNIDIYSSDTKVADAVKDCMNTLTSQLRLLTKVSNILESQSHLGSFHQAIVNTSSVDYNEILRASFENISSTKSDLEDTWRKFESLAVFGVGANRESLIYELAQLIDKSEQLCEKLESKISSFTSSLDETMLFLHNQIDSIKSLTSS